MRRTMLFTICRGKRSIGGFGSMEEKERPQPHPFISPLSESNL
jgi:hypothetical protein